MFNSKFDIFDSEWIEMVFENRNKSYGAYDLRKNYAFNLIKAFIIVFLVVAGGIIAAAILFARSPATVGVKSEIDVENKNYRVIAGSPARHASPGTLIPGGEADPSNRKGKSIDSEDADVKPTPPGGAEEWNKFLEKNLHYPAEALEQRVEGIVKLNFIVERDGHITNIMIDHLAGHGFDQEALRVLNLSPVWKPGMQNGQTVRVKYTMPIGFRIAHR